MDSNSEKQAFLDRLASTIQNEKHPKLLVVLPNRRSLFVLKEKLGEERKAQLYTIDDLMQQLTGSRLIEPEELQVSFYQAYCEKEKKPQSFDQFTSWAVTFLSDINDIDLHLGDVKEIYEHIEAYHQTGEGFANEEAGPLEKAYLSFWDRLPGYYDLLRETLEKLKLAYRGLIYRRVAEKAAANSADLQEFFDQSKVYWVGIIPGNPSERALLQWLQEHAALELFADLDRFYLETPRHESGRLFREYPLKENVRWTVDLLQKDAKILRVHPLPGKMAQITKVKTLIDDIPEDERSDTVVVLADQALLLPFMEVFGRTDVETNITSGFPMRSTLIHRFIMSWVTLHANAIQRDGKKYFYHKNLEEFLDYSIVQAWLSGAVSWSGLRGEVVKRNIKFVSADWLKTKMEGDLFAEKAHHLLFDWPDNLDEVFQRINDVLTEWNSNTKRLVISALEAKAIDQYIAKLKLLLSQFNEVLPANDLRGLKKFIHRQIGYSKLTLEQPRNAAVQVMGMLETRMIDFKHVIVVGASDDYLPGAPRSSTHVPYIHRNHFKLPTHRDTESLTAYHFYRLLQRASTIDMIYSTSHDKLSSGEPSRYLLQIQEELSGERGSMHRSTSEYNIRLNKEDLQPLQVYKSEEILAATKTFLSRKVSATAINRFINSPLEFYYYNVLGLKEEDTVEEDITPGTLGNVVHKVLEITYKPFEGKQLQSSALRKCKDEAIELVHKRFAEDFQSDDLTSGRNLLMVEMAKHYVEEFLDFEINDLEQNGAIEILSVEERLHHDITIDGQTVRLFGFADRIDRRNGVVRIIDYKSGRVEPRELNYKEDELKTNRAFSKALQLSLYKYMYSRIHQINAENIEASIFSMKRFANGYISLSDDYSHDSFEEVLTFVIRAMLDPTQPLMHKDDSAYVTF